MNKKVMIVTIPLYGLSRQNSKSKIQEDRNKFESENPEFRIAFLYNRENGAERMSIVYDESNPNVGKLKIYHLDIPTYGLLPTDSTRLISERTEQVEKDLRLSSSERLIVTNSGEVGSHQIYFI